MHYRVFLLPLLAGTSIAAAVAIAKRDLNAPVDNNTTKQHGNEALDGLRTLGTLLISNGQFRKLLSDATNLLHNVARNAAQSTATEALDASTSTTATELIENIDMVDDTLENIDLSDLPIEEDGEDDEEEED